MFDSIALSGGGVRGGLLIGGLCALEKLRGNLEFSQGIYGCSIGSIVATAIAFGLNSETLKKIFEEEFHLSRAIPDIRLPHILEFSKTKGLFSMEMLGELVKSSFKKHGVDLENKKISDANQKLYILAVNLTTRRPTWFTGDIGVIEAIQASCCLPFVFHPQIIHNNVYIDGGIYVKYIHKVVPEDCLVFHIRRPEKPLFPSELETMPIQDMFIHIYSAGEKVAIPQNVVLMENETVQILQELSNEDKKVLFETGYNSVTRFWSQRCTDKL